MFNKPPTNNNNGVSMARQGMPRHGVPWHGACHFEKQGTPVHRDASQGRFCLSQENNPFLNQCARAPHYLTGTFRFSKTRPFLNCVHLRRNILPIWDRVLCASCSVIFSLSQTISNRSKPCQTVSNHLKPLKTVYKCICMDTKGYITTQKDTHKWY